jgi:hypothetical protein
MKLPVYQYRESAIADVQTPRLSVAAEQVVPKAIEGVGKDLGDLAGAYAHTERLIEESRQVVATAQFLSDLQDQAQPLIDQPDISMPAGTYAATVRTGLDQRLQEHLKTIPDERLRNRVQAHIAGKITDYTRDAWHAASRRLVESMQASALTQAESLAQQAANAPTDASAEETRQLFTGLMAGLTEAGAFHPVEAQKLTQGFGALVDQGRVLRAGQANPWGTIKSLWEEDPTPEGGSRYRNYPNLGIAQRATLARELRQQAEHNETRIERELKRGQEITAATLRERAWNADPTVTQDIFAQGPAGTQAISEPEQRELLALAEVRRKQDIRQSEPETRRMVIADVTALMPTLRHGDLVRLNTQGLLSDDDLEKYGNALTGRIKYDIAQAKIEDREAKRDYDEEYRNAQEILRYSLRPRGILANVPMMRQRASEIQDRAAEELLAATKLAGSQRRPMDVLNKDILPKHKPLLDAASSLTVENLQSLIQDTDSVDALKKARAAGRIGEDEYFSRLRILQQIESMKTKARQAAPAPTPAEEFPMPVFSP